MAHAPDLSRAVRYGFFNRHEPGEHELQPHLVRNAEGDTMLRLLKQEMQQARSMYFSVAFVTPGGLALLKQDLLDFEGPATLVTSTYLNFNKPETFRELLRLDRVKVRVIDDPTVGFHSKGYLFNRGHSTSAIVGSSNLTRGALLSNAEWNLRVSASPAGDLVRQLARTASEQRRRSKKLTPEWIDAYEETWTPTLPAALREDGPVDVLPSGVITPNAMQQEALARIEEVTSAGEQRALIVSATGTGKTILAAFAARDLNPTRVLFVAHREQILSKAAVEFQRVLGWRDSDIGWLSGSRHDLRAPHVFATVQTIGNPKHLASIDPQAFDVIVIDEVHRAAADSYLRVIEHFQPKFMLGLTATPERTDGNDIYGLFHHNVPYEIRLQRALESNMLAPFNYYGVEDYIDGKGETVTETTDLARLTAEGRINHLIAALTKYGHAGQVCGLMFCSHVHEAQALSELLNEREVGGKRLRTAALSGSDSIAKREALVAQLEAGKLDYLLTVDIFNEGIDIPSVNQVVMLRSTQSSIVFTQQLGRGLRKAPGKDHLRVIDFIGNYANNYLIPIALFGSRSLNKDDIRKRLIEGMASGSIAGVSSVNFTQVARERVFASLATAKLNSKAELKAAFLDLRNRLGRVPRLLDFTRFDSVDPVVMGTSAKHYLALVRSFGMKEAGEFSPVEDDALAYVTTEFLNGKRPHELLLLQKLLQQRSAVSMADLRELFTREHVTHDEATIRSVIRLLDLSFLTDAERKRYGNRPLVVETSGSIRLHPDVREAYSTSPSFRSNFDDVIATGLVLARDRYGFSSHFVVGERYSRKDACRLLNWSTNQMGVMYGYKTDAMTQTCPIFVTYHKASDITESTAYEDEFLDAGTMRWFTRSKRTLQTAEVKAILGTNPEVTKHLFVKKDDAEGTDFYYAGEVTPHEAKDDRMPNGSTVVTMRLRLRTPLTHDMYDYFTRSMTEANASHEQVTRGPDEFLLPAESGD